MGFAPPACYRHGIVSITQRILESAQSQWSKLTNLVIVDEEPLSHVEGPALQEELLARKAAAAAVADHPAVTAAGAGPAARAARERAASQRKARVTREREEREAKQRAAADEAFRRVQDQARRTGASVPPRATTGGASAGPQRPPRPGSTESQLAEWYRTLGVAPGADMAQIKSSYRQLMRKYHPDMHAGNPQKQKAATELSLRVTAAYNGLVDHLDKR